MTFINHSNNLSLVTLSFPSSTPPPSSTASSSSPSSTGWTERISEKIQELKSELDDLKNLKEAQNNYLTEQDSKSLDSLPTQLTSLETVQKLAEFADQLDTNKNNNDNILNNLCTGLETFLGFNSTSKGYTGQGIVYSDLDRLCDGVMGFFHGVFDTIKSEDAVGIYNKYMPDYNKINKVIQTLEKLIGQGRNGIPNSVGQVKAWLEGYESVVKTNTQAVKDELRRLIDDLEGNHKMTINENSSLEAQLSDWKSVLHKIEVHVTQTQTKHISRLDRRLEEAVVNEIKPIKDVVQQLKSVTYTAFETQVKAVDTKFETLPVELNNQIEKEAKRFKDILDRKFNEIGGKVESFRTGQLQNIMNSKDALSAALTNIKEQEIGDKNSGAHKKILALLEKLRLDVSNVHKTLDEKKKELDPLVSHAQTQFTIISRGIAEGYNDPRQTDISIEKNWKQLYTTIESLVEGLTKKDQNNEACLVDIEEEVHKYAKMYGQEFSETVTQWVEEIMRGDAVKGLLRKYVNNNHGSHLFSGNLHDSPDHMVEELTPIVQTKILIGLGKISVDKNVGIKTGVDENLSEIVRYINSYTEHITDKDSAIVSDVEIALKGNADFRLTNSATFTSDLKSVIQSALAAVKSAAEATAESIKKLREKSHISNLTQAIRNVTLIGTSIDHSIIGNHGGNIDTALTTVKAAIGVLNPILQNVGGTLKIGVDKLQSEVLTELENIRSESVTGRIASKKKDVTETLEDLKVKIDRAINVVVQQLIELEAEVEQWIKQTKEKIKHAHETAKSELNNFNAKKKMFVEDTFQKAKFAVLSMFAKRHQADLDSLKKLVVKQKCRIDGFIQDDTTHGVKGFLRVLYGGNYLSPNGKGSSDNLLYKLTDEMTKNSATTSNAAPKLNQYFNAVLMYVYEDVKTFFTTPPQDPYSPSVMKVRNKIEIVLERIETHSYDYRFVELLVSLKSTLSDLISRKFGDVSYPVLDVVKTGFDRLSEELDYAYVSSYSGESITWEKGKQLTRDSHRCASIFLSCMTIYFRDLNELRRECNGLWKRKCINLEKKNKHGRQDVANPLGAFLQKSGFIVASDEKTQNGELSNQKYNGEDIYHLLLIMDLLNADDDIKCADDKKSILRRLDDNILRFYQLCHLKSVKSPKSPSSVYEMLIWLTGLPFNPIYKKLSDYIKTCFPKPDKYKDTEYSDISSSFLRIEASPKSFTGDHIERLLKHVTYRSHKVLTTILGHGHARGRYACEFNMNPYELLYPSNAASCFDLLVEIIYRLLQQLSFLYEQCCHSNQLGGWRGCHYGKGIGGSRWQCNDLECPNQARNRKSDQASNQIYIQKGDQHSNGGIRSPLQSFLEDGLQGFLPHPYNKLDCKVTCSLPNHDGIPCKTPMGFQDLGIVASRTGTGQDIKEVLQSFCGNENSPVNQLCSYLTCLLHSPPTTLGDMFAFYYTFLHEWNDSGTHKKDGFNNAVRKANFENSNTKFDVTPMFMSTEHSQKHLKGDLYSLVSCSNTYTSARPCGPYIKSLSLFSRDTYSKEHSGYYLSWIVYITETFYELLAKLSHECHASCSTGHNKCDTTECAEDCEAKKLPMCSESHHETSCVSIVHCSFTLPTLSKYGLYYGSATLLSGDKVSTMKRSCKDLCTVLENICSEGSVLSDFVKIRIPAFLWNIRYKFFYTAVALWLLSLLYLIHIMVIRLDLLHIKSHLHSPSSHRIAAQSLLAAGRVNKLNRVFYLQP